VYSNVPHVNRGDTPESWHAVCLIFGRGNCTIIFSNLRDIIKPVKTKVRNKIILVSKVVMGSGQTFLTRVGSGQFFWLGSGWVGSAINGLG